MLSSLPRAERAFRSLETILAPHGLDPSQGSVLPNTSFVLPPLQGKNLDEHFHRLGAAAAQPWLELARDFSSASLPPKPDYWSLQSGWTKYVYQEDGSSYHIPLIIRTT